MVTIKEIFRDQVRPLIHLAYDGDDDLLKKYHIKEYVLEEAVESQMSMINTTRGEVDLNYYKVLFNNAPIGYFVTFKECLYSFGIGMEWRTKEILIQVWDKIKSVLEETFVCILYKNNTRAINWLLKCGMRVVENDFKDNSVTLVT